eukprot:gene16795-4723_t
MAATLTREQAIQMNKDVVEMMKKWKEDPEFEAMEKLPKEERKAKWDAAEGKIGEAKA